MQVAYGLGTKTKNRYNKKNYKRTFASALPPPPVRIRSHFDGPHLPTKCKRNNWMPPWSLLRCFHAFIIDFEHILAHTGPMPSLLTLNMFWSAGITWFIRWITWIIPYISCFFLQQIQHFIVILSFFFRWYGIL